MPNKRKHQSNRSANQAWTTTNTGRHITVDFKNYDLLQKHTWSDCPYGIYARSYMKGRAWFLHRIVGIRKGLDPELQMDALDGNFLNCTEANIISKSKAINKNRLHR